MSRNVQATKKPICTFCLNLGKTENEYSHYTYSLPDHNGKSKTLCKELLNTECRYCYQSGHTTKYCKVLEKQNKKREHAEKRETIAKKTKQTVPKHNKPVSVFAALMDSDSEDELNVSKKVSKPVENYPVLCPHVNKVEEQEVKTGWAAIVAKPAEVKKVVEPTKLTGLVMLSDYIKSEPKVEVNKLASWTKKQPVAKKSWADESDTEDETEDEYMHYVEEVDDTW